KLQRTPRISQQPTVSPAYIPAMSSSPLSFCSAFIHGIVLLETELSTSGDSYGTKRYEAIIPVKRSDDVPETAVPDTAEPDSTTGVSLENLLASISAFVPSDTERP